MSDDLPGGSSTPPVQPPPPLAPSGESPLTAVTAILTATRPWVRLMGIFGFISVAFMFVVGIGAGIAGLATGNPATASLMVVYPLLAMLYVFPSLYLLRYAARIKDFAAGLQPQQLAAALDAQRAFWKFIAILTLVSVFLGIAFFVLAIGLGIMAGMAATGSGGF